MKNITISKIQYQSTHSKLCVPIINRIYKKMKAGIRFAEIKVEGNIICDGHHRYIASLLANYNLELISWPLQSEVIIIDWNTVSFEEIDWDNENDILKYNKQDAEYNNLSYDKIVDILK